MAISLTPIKEATQRIKSVTTARTDGSQNFIKAAEVYNDFRGLYEDMGGLMAHARTDTAGQAHAVVERS